jgi:hypothetical protein
MPLFLANLDADIRQRMLTELQLDLDNNRLHLSPYLSGQGVHDYPVLLRTALAEGDDETLAQALGQQRRLERASPRKQREGGYALASVPSNAAQVIAESEFNRYYMRAVAQRAIAAGITQLVVYRAKPVAEPRPTSEALLETTIDPHALLGDLRSHTGEVPELGIPAGPGSGLSVRLPE